MTGSRYKRKYNNYLLSNQLTDAFNQIGFMQSVGKQNADKLNNTGKKDVCFERKCIKGFSVSCPKGIL